MFDLALARLSHPTKDTVRIEDGGECGRLRILWWDAWGSGECRRHVRIAIKSQTDALCPMARFEVQSRREELGTPRHMLTES